MKAIATKTVRELALEIPSATRVFEKLGIDYCCGGQKPLQEACTTAHISVDDVVEKLEAAERQAAPSFQDKNWQDAALNDLVQHILSTHHAYVQEEVPRLQQLLAKVCGVHGNNHPELLQIQEIFSSLAEEL